MSGSAASAWMEVVTVLWPGSSVHRITRRAARGRAGEGSFRELVFLPNAREPRLLLPAGVPAASAAALHRYSHGLRTKERFGRNLLAAALRTGLPELGLPDRLRISEPAADSIEDYLGKVLDRDVVVSIHLGNARINRKPVLHALTPSGESVAFVKVGDSEITRALIRCEEAALRFIGSHSFEHFTTPRVLHYGSWHDLELLVLSPLATTVRRGTSRTSLPLAAMRELAGLEARSPGAVGDSPFWRELIAEPPAWLWGEGDAWRIRGELQFEKLSPALTRIGERYHDVALSTGPWHGDWTPWNMDWSGNTVQLWDWERCARRVPRGFDVLHYRLQDAARSSGELDHLVLDAWLADMPATLEPFDVSGRAASATAALYLADLCKRYLPATLDPGTSHGWQALRLLDYVCDRAGRL